MTEEVNSDLDAIRSKIDAIAARVAETPTVPFGAAGEIFAAELRTLPGDALPDPGAVRRAARLAVAEQAWSQRLGSLLETRDVVKLLDVSNGAASGRPWWSRAQALQGEKAVRGGHERGVVMPTETRAAFVVVEAEVALELLVVELDLPAQPREPREPLGGVSAGRLESQ